MACPQAPNLSTVLINHSYGLRPRRCQIGGGEICEEHDNTVWPRDIGATAATVGYTCGRDRLIVPIIYGGEYICC